MGLAASQARYLSLVARKSNCEYEGQQINQSRLNLANKSANLFNQMLGLNVPIPPTKQDFMKMQYTYVVDGTEHKITDWHQLSAEDSDGYNYVVESEYTTKLYTGSQKKLSDPQVQFSGSGPTAQTSYSEQIAKIQDALLAIENCKTDYEEAQSAYNSFANQAKNLTYYRDTSFSGLTSDDVTETSTGYTIKGRNYTKYNNLSDADKTVVQTALNTLIENGALEEGSSLQNICYDNATGTMSFINDDIVSVQKGTRSILYTYHPDSTEEGVHGIKQTKELLDELKDKMQVALQNLDNAKADYEKLDVPTHVGNYVLTPISKLSDSQETAISQIIKDMQKAGIATNLTRCFNTVSGDYSKDTYSGGIYFYEKGNITIYATYYDLADSYVSSGGIDNQSKLPVYSVSDVETTIKNTEKALLETDDQGRFTSVRFENDSIVYNLTVTEIEDTVAYEDAMNKYDYNKALYDKKVQDINAQTSLIQREDQDLELRLKQLDTEQNALATEIDAVAKVVKDNIEKSFKTFGG